MAGIAIEITNTHMINLEARLLELFLSVFLDIS